MSSTRKGLCFTSKKEEFDLSNSPPLVRARSMIARTDVCSPLEKTGAGLSIKETSLGHCNIDKMA